MKKLLLTIALGSACLFAQGPDPAQMIERRVAHLTSALSLTTDQAASIKTILTSEQTAVQALRTSSSAARTALREAITALSPDATIDSLAVPVGSAEGQMVAIHGKAEVKLLSVLTAAQRTTYAAMGPGGFGGPGGRRGPGGMGMMPPPPQQ